jgi:hypothetical protein
MFAACIDVGKPGRNLGWATDEGGQRLAGNDLDTLVSALSGALQRGPASLGLECPLFIPLRADPLQMTQARQGECGKGLKSRPFSAGAGPTVAVLGIMTACYVLGRLRSLVPGAAATLDWRSPPAEPGRLLLWEAFVTAQRKTHETRHVEDAQLALDCYLERMRNPAQAKSSVHEPECLSLVGVALLRTRWTDDPGVLAQQCLVVRV